MRRFSWNRVCVHVCVRATTVLIARRCVPPPTLPLFKGLCWSLVVSRSRVSASVYWSTYNTVKLIHDLFWVTTKWMLYQGETQMCINYSCIPMRCLLTSCQKCVSIYLFGLYFILFFGLSLSTWHRDKICHHLVIMQPILALDSFMICCQTRGIWNAQQKLPRLKISPQQELILLFPKQGLVLLLLKIQRQSASHIFERFPPNETGWLRVFSPFFCSLMLDPMCRGVCG